MDNERTTMNSNIEYIVKNYFMGSVNTNNINDDKLVNNDNSDVKNVNSTKTNENEIEISDQELLNRVYKAPQVLQDLITSSLPYLMLSPNQQRANAKNCKSKSLNAGDGDFKGVKKNIKKRRILKVESGDKKHNLRKKETRKSLKVVVNKTNCVKKVSQSKNITEKNVENEIKKPILKTRKRNTKSGLYLRKTFSQILNENPGKITINALRNSSLFSITEKSFLSLKKYSPIEIDVLLLQKLFALDTQIAVKLITILMQYKYQQATIYQILDDNKLTLNDLPNDKRYNSPSKIEMRKTLIKQLYTILLTRLTAHQERLAEILYSVVMKLWEKNKITHYNIERRMKICKKNLDVVHEFDLTRTKPQQDGPSYLRALSNHHQELIAKMKDLS